jgi:phosphoglycolate phosphatase
MGAHGINGVRHVVWDWNGTLLDDTAACVATINRMMAARGLGSVDAVRYREVFGFPVRGYYEALGFDFAREDWDAVANEYHRVYAEESRRAALREGMRAVLTSLHAAGVPMSVLSASEHSRLEQMLREHAVAHYFGCVRGLSDLYAHSKVEAGRALLRVMDRSPSEVVLIGDTTHDHEVADALGCRCVLMAGGHQSASRLRACGVQVADDPEGMVRLLWAMLSRQDMRAAVTA